MKYSRTLASLAIWGLGIIVSQAEDSLPLFSGFIASPSMGVQFAMKWKSADGSHLQAWLQLGAKVSEFRLIDFDPKTEVLTIEDRVGRRHQLTLPQSRVQSEQLTDSEFSELAQYLFQDTRSAPVLSRDKARAFYLRWISQGSVPEGVEIILDPRGDTLSPEMRARWGDDQRRARAANRLLLAVVVNGSTTRHEFPRHPHPIPEQMTRNLLDADWDEIAMLNATNSLKRRIARRSN